jgi:ribonuclease G
MAKELIISTNGREKKIAIIENDKVTEFYIERGESNQGIVGNIYKGRVMRVLPGMQSAFVDIGLERDAFLYVSDFFDEEEEFERIVIDKTRKGESADVEHAAAEQVAQSRVEREQRIEATQERMEPLRDADLTTETTAPVSGTEAVSAESAEQASRRRGRRGRRRGRTPDRYEQTQETSQAPGVEVEDEAEEIDTPFGAADPSVQRVVDEDEAAVNGEMFKDARLQERILDQIHAREFNIEDDSRTAEVGSVLPVNFASGSFQRVDDGDALSAAEVPQRQARKPVAARLDSFTDEGLETLAVDSSFQRVSDDEEAALGSDQDDEETDADTAAASEKKKRSTRRPAAAKSAKKKAPVKKGAAAKKSTKRSTNGEADEAEPTESLADAEASISSGPSLAEFATRRGGRRRRRPSGKPKPEGGTEGTAIEGQEPEPEAVGRDRKTSSQRTCSWNR